MSDFKEDSTRGKARIMPVNYKGDVLAQAWLDARQLAVLSVWLDNNGYVTRHLSDVIRITIEEVASKLIDSGTVKKIEFTKDARALLKGKYRASLNPSGRGERNLLHNLHLDELRQSNVYKGESGKSGSRVVDDETVRRSVEIYEQKLKEEQDRKFEEDVKKQMKAAQNSPRLVKDDYHERQKKKMPSVKGHEDIIIDVERNKKMMEEYDKKLDDMP